MKTFDTYSLQLLEFGKRFLEKGRAETSEDARVAYLISSLLISCSSLEAFINGIIEEIKDWDKFSLHERALLLEKSVCFDDGEFIMTNRLQMSRLKDKIELLLRKFKCKSNYRKESWWSLLNNSIDIKNSLSHPKEIRELKYEQVRNAIESIMDAIDFIFKTIYRKHFPSKKKGFNSVYSF